MREYIVSAFLSAKRYFPGGEIIMNRGYSEGRVLSYFNQGPDFGQDPVFVFVEAVK